ncbi:uncharacterized protein EAF01_001829 [Botrytis porri]|uniref:Methyltransferase domain-containing protein n=1 Tax=Botrytis porri TaxID=87229 RepID=A0A4Z1L5V4_9HELO|nr:uncharacterized protein EAF01_001829 [Botrytis porri]KAF7912808.1 hypothetical protein EAF01_001829 [Botrytis porri]TGO92056.1 hypothetical protein BPOR_0011g00060 [Botrytis porri]
MTNSSHQYDTIQRPYDYIRTSSIALIERSNVHSALTPYIHNARILELACGSGFYTHAFQTWGAQSVLGVDISTVMISSAPRLANISYMQGDCSIPTPYFRDEDEAFDIVFAAWLLNYAGDRRGLVDMFRNIAMNLKEGGRFVGVTVPPTSDPRGSVSAEASARPMSRGGSGYLVYEHIRDVEEGIYFRVRGDTPVGELEFECYHLRREVYEECAREAGLKGKLEWGVTEVPERWLRGEGEGGASLQELESYREIPNYGILVIEK